MPPLIADRLQRRVFTLIALGFAVLVILAAIVWHGSTTGVDTWVTRELKMHLRGAVRFQVLQFSAPMFSTSMLAVVALGAVATRRWALLALAIVSPLAGLFVTEIVLKPLVARHLGPVLVNSGKLMSTNGSFPSGHETAVASAAVVVAVAAGQLRPSRLGCALIGLLLAAWTLTAGAGLVRENYHYATDVLAAIGVSAAVTLSIALAIDALGRRGRQSDGAGDGNRTRTVSLGS